MRQERIVAVEDATTLTFALGLMVQRGSDSTYEIEAQVMAGAHCALV